MVFFGGSKHGDVFDSTSSTKFEGNGRTDGRTDDGEFNSPPFSLREAGDKNGIVNLKKGHSRKKPLREVTEFLVKAPDLLLSIYQPTPQNCCTNLFINSFGEIRQDTTLH